MITDREVNAKYVGVYVIGPDPKTSPTLSTTFKPNWFQRFVSWCQGWHWMTIEEYRKRRNR